MPVASEPMPSPNWSPPAASPPRSWPSDARPAACRHHRLRRLRGAQVGQDPGPRHRRLAGAEGALTGAFRPDGEEGPRRERAEGRAGAECRQRKGRTGGTMSDAQADAYETFLTDLLDAYDQALRGFDQRFDDEPPD